MGQIIGQIFEVFRDQLVFALNSHGHFIELSDGWSEKLGWTREQMLEKSCLAFLHPDDVTSTQESMVKLISGQSVVDLSIRGLRSDGTYAWMCLDASVDPETKIVYGYAKDVTDSRRTQLVETVVQSQLRIGHWEIDLASKELFWSRVTHLIHETDPETYRPMLEDGLQFYPPESRAILEPACEKLFTEGTPYDLRLRFVTARGNPLWVRATASADMLHGRPRRVIGTFQDVTKQFVLESDLIEEKAQLRNLIENSPGMAYLFKMEPSGRAYFTFVSNRALDIYGLTQQDFLENPAIMLEMTHEDDAEGLQICIEESARTMLPFEWTGRARNREGAVRWIEAKSIPRPMPDGAICWDGLIMDITREREREEQLLRERSRMAQASRLASLGEMSAGIAHEINNPLGIITGALELLAKSRHDETRHEKGVRMIRRGADRIAKIVSGLKRFSRSNDAKTYRDHCLAGVVRDLLFLTDVISRRAQVEILPQLETEAMVKCDDLEIEQVIVNLISNAIDAAKHRPEKWVRLRLFEENGSVVLRVSDSGPGVPQEIVDRIFDPFFTTKPVGEGTGLGLSIIKGILDEHGAKIDVTKIDGHTCFEIRFPKVEAASVA